VARRVNLCPNPALANNTTGWSFPSGWNRSTSVTTLPRTTGLKGTSAPSNTLISPQMGVTSGKAYVVSFSIHYTNSSGTNTFDYSIDWYNSSGSYLSSAGGNTRSAAPFGITERLEFGPVTAPSSAVSAVLVIAGLDSGAEVTAVLFEQTSTTGGTYFDGGSTGASWAGTPGNSTSSLLLGTDTIGVADAGSLVSVTPGPTGTEGGAFAESASVVASGITGDAIGFADGAMIISIGYDDIQGRVRVSAFGLPATAVRAVVNSRTKGASRFTPVRGGRVAISGGAFARTVDDYEFPSGLDTEYQVIVYANPENTPDQIVISAIATQGAIDPEVWLKFIPSPLLNRRVMLTGWAQIGRSSRNARFDVKGRKEPIVITDVHSSRAVTINLRTSTVAEGDALDQALSAGVPAFLHTPVGMGLPTMYVAIGDHNYTRPSLYSTVRSWTVDLTEVSPPPPSVFGPATTWQTILDGYATWADVLAAFPTWADLLGG
jgi:hypothetical protein